VVGLDGEGHIGLFADFGQWEAWLEEEREGIRDQGLGIREQKGSSAGEPDIQKPAKKKLSYMEAREFAGIEQRVEKSDARLASARDRVEDPAIASDAAALQAALVELDQAQEENDLLYARWAELTEKGV